MPDQSAFGATLPVVRCAPSTNPCMTILYAVRNRLPIGGRPWPTPAHQLLPARGHDRGDAGRDGALRARGDAAAGELGGPRARAGGVLVLRQLLERPFRKGVLDHAIKELCRVYISRTSSASTAATSAPRRAARRARRGPVRRAAELRELRPLRRRGRRPRSPTPRRSPGGWTPTTRSGSACTRTSASPSWSSWAA